MGTISNRLPKVKCARHRDKPKQASSVPASCVYPTLSEDTQPPLTPRQGLDYRGRVPDASPQYKPKFLQHRACTAGILQKKCRTTGKKALAYRGNGGQNADTAFLALRLGVVLYLLTLGRLKRFFGQCDFCDLGPSEFRPESKEELREAILAWLDEPEKFLADVPGPYLRLKVPMPSSGKKSLR